MLKCGDITASTLPLSKSGLSAFRADIFAGRVYAALGGQNATARFMAVEHWPLERRGGVRDQVGREAENK